VAVFGAQLNSQGSFPPYVLQEIDRAIKLIEAGATHYLVFCGSHALKQGLQGPTECEVARAYVAQHHPSYLKRFRGEDKSTNIPENWLLMKLGFPHLEHIHLITIEPLLPRVQWLGQMVYGNDAELSFEALPWPAQDFPNEKRLLQDAQCTLTERGFQGRRMGPGEHRFLLDESTSRSRWNELRLDHHNCPSYGSLHH
jgi:hypothetical protein